MFCPSCGHETVKDARYCGYCGQLLGGAPVTVPIREEKYGCSLAGWGCLILILMIVSFLAGVYFAGKSSSALVVTPLHKRGLSILETGNDTFESMQKKMDSIMARAREGATFFSIDLTTGELNSYLEQEIMKQKNLPLKKLRVELEEDTLCVMGLVSTFGFEVFVRVVFDLLMIDDRMEFRVREASIGDCEVPESIMSGYISFLNRQIKNSFEGKGGPSFSFGQYQGLWKKVKVLPGLLHVEGEIIKPGQLQDRLLSPDSLSPISENGTGHNR